MNARDLRVQPDPRFHRDTPSLLITRISNGGPWDKGESFQTSSF